MLGGENCFSCAESGSWLLEKRILTWKKGNTQNTTHCYQEEF